MANRKPKMPDLRLGLTMGLAVIGALAFAGSALGGEAVRFVDGQGNRVIRMPDNGAKIIRVGAAQAAVSSAPQRVRIISAPRDHALAHIVARPGSTCESAVVLHGRAFMYGIDHGETPVLDHPGCGYQ
ncbi:hypothetical protein AVM02_07210 [Brucella anthropi]|uniref:hypothetical protein n=1 Tax=Brucella anthropi TaxID=529 RepID=UPI003988543F